MLGRRQLSGRADEQIPRLNREMERLSMERERRSQSIGDKLSFRSQLHLRGRLLGRGIRRNGIAVSDAVPTLERRRLDACAGLEQFDSRGSSYKCHMLITN